MATCTDTATCNSELLKEGIHSVANGTSPTDRFVQESRFGNWFLRTRTWHEHVLTRALDDLQAMLPPSTRCHRVLDIGCGYGHAFAELVARFGSREIVGLDADATLLDAARPRAAKCSATVELLVGNAADIKRPDGDFDMVFCHQTFHHLVEQEAAMAEFWRVLKPGGWLLFAESTRKYIHSLPIRLLFRHPMEVQRSAEEYLGMIRAAGFTLPPSRISTPYLWWSRSDLGVLEFLGRPTPADREETLINAVAAKP